MAAKTKQQLVLLGSGNIAWHLAKLLSRPNRHISVYNRKYSSRLKKFSTELKCETFTGFDAIRSDGDIYLVCVSDRFIGSVSERIKAAKKNALLLHCSGSQPLHVLKSNIKNKAVVYPLQSFSMDAEVDWKNIPLLLQVGKKESLVVLKKFISEFPGPRRFVNDKERLRWHLAAVLVNNFSNAFYTEAFGILKENTAEGDFKFLLPLMQQGIDKLKHLSPIQAQTGPAARKDTPVMREHLKLLEHKPELHRLYRQMSRLIVQQQKNKHA
jgi:predicted short-subunit dehydrogenase-like oxidoreductase (DUF2520 family)